jgi:cathepsin F
MKAIVALVCLSACAFALTFQNDPFWVAYKQQFGKTYAKGEEAAHYEIFKKNMAHAAELNEIDTASYGWTKFSDEERKSRPLDIPAYIRRTDVLLRNDLPTSFDWRQKGAVSSVKDQAQCGSCWAFATVSACEGAHFIEHNKLFSLAPQELVDCDTYDHGCDGGWPTNAMNYIKARGGLMQESDYGYTARTGSCRFDSSKVKMQVKGVYTFTAHNEEKMMTALQQYGPLAVAIDASKFNSYSSGIMNAVGCYAGSPDHGVTVVGWGVENGSKYWIVKNSWGSDWGESGYVRMLRGVNCCGIEDYPMGVTAV